MDTAPDSPDGDISGTEKLYLGSVGGKTPLTTETVTFVEAYMTGPSMPASRIWIVRGYDATVDIAGQESWPVVGLIAKSVVLPAVIEYTSVSPEERAPRDKLVLTVMYQQGELT
jgi:hypothetical protein